MHLLALTMLVVRTMAFLGPVSSQPPANCTRSCGRVSIPFPFGITGEEGCYYDRNFNVTCNETIDDRDPIVILRSRPPIHITSIATNTSEVDVMTMVAYDCDNNKSSLSENRTVPFRQRLYSSFTFSARNRFVAVGCNAEAYVRGRSEKDEIAVSGCVSTCNGISDTTNGSCSGVGCCEVEIPKGMGLSSKIVLNSYENFNRSNCNYAFIVAEGEYIFNSTDLLDDFGGKNMMMPQIYNWDIGTKTCKQVKESKDYFLCTGKSECDKDHAGPGYRCRCLKGYDGNPYTKDGCINIDECKDGNHTCKTTDQCNDTEGGYTCDTDISRIIEISVGTSVAGLFLIVLFTLICVGLRRHKKLMLREKYFKQNGGIMLKQRISGDGGSHIQTKVFTVEELKKATNNYHESTIIGKGGFGTVYRGALPDDTLVAIKKSKIADPDETQVEQFINEVIIVSQINHRNVVKLIGCCLETQVPSLVYEFIPNGTLFDHIHDECKSKLITWAIRLKLATETAGALSYLHSAASVPIIHRDVKPMNILIDDNYVAKVADFGASKLNPTDQNELETMVQGTRGYLDPEYLQTGQLTEKSDVYSFGAVLVEILTGKKIVDFNKPENERHVTRYFITCLKEDTLLQVLDEKLQLKEVPHEIIQVSRLAQRCLHLKGDERPTMKEVALELEGISASKIENHPWVKSTSNEEQTECLLNGPSEDCEDTNASAFFSIIAKPKV